MPLSNAAACACPTPVVAKLTGTARPIPLALPIREFSLLNVQGSVTNGGQTASFEKVGRLAFTLPFAINDETSLVNVATIKALLDRSKETMFRRDGPRWEVLSDEYLVDVTDNSIEFRLGPIQFYS
jgi:hypothetical protein